MPRPAQRRRRLSVIPSSTCATVSQASTAASSDSKMSFQRITTIGSVPCANSDATPSRSRRSPSFSRRWISTRCGASSSPVRRQRSACDDRLAGRDQHVGELDRLLHRRLDGVEAELGGGLLGVVDDVVERGREHVAVARVERPAAHAPAAVEPVDDVVGDAVALALAGGDLLRERGVLGELREQLAQQHRRSAARCARRPRAGSSGSCRPDREASASTKSMEIGRSRGSSLRFLHDSITSWQLPRTDPP